MTNEVQIGNPVYVGELAYQLYRRTWQGRVIFGAQIGKPYVSKKTGEPMLLRNYDEKYLDEVKSLCASTAVHELNPLFARARSLKGLFRKQALSIPYYFDQGLADWVENTLETRKINSIIAYSSPKGSKK